MKISNELQKQWKWAYEPVLCWIALLSLKREREKMFTLRERLCMKMFDLFLKMANIFSLYIYTYTATQLTSIARQKEQRSNFNYKWLLQWHILIIFMVLFFEQCPRSAVIYCSSYSYLVFHALILILFRLI